MFLIFLKKNLKKYQLSVFANPGVRDLPEFLSPFLD